MPATKRKSSYNLHVDERLSKAARTTHHDSEDAAFYSRSRLNAMPAEILESIFWLAVEPAFLHTCHRMWHLTKPTSRSGTPILPPYPEFTKKLAGLAMCGKDRLDDTDAYSSRMILMLPYSLPRAGLEVSEANRPDGIDKRRRQELQKAVFTSTWFGAKHFDAMHVELFAAALSLSTDEPQNHLSQGQKRKIKKFLKETNTMSTSPSLSLVFNRETSGLVSYKAQPDLLGMWRRGWGGWLWQVLDIDRIPSDLLTLPLTPVKTRLLINLAKAPCINQTPEGVYVDQAMISPAIEYVLTNYKDDGEGILILTALLIIESESRRKEAPLEAVVPNSIPPSVIDPKLFRTASFYGTTSCMSRLLGHSPNLIIANEELLLQLRSELAISSSPNSHAKINLIENALAHAKRLAATGTSEMAIARFRSQHAWLEYKISCGLH